MEYASGSVYFAEAENKPHAALVMCDSKVAPEGTMLVSELVAPAQLVKHQLRHGKFTNHHTKPVSLFLS